MTDTAEREDFERAMETHNGLPLNVYVTAYQDGALAGWQARAALPARAPEGFVLVPRELTYDMQAAFSRQSNMSAATTSEDLWEAMLSAAPPPPEQGEGIGLAEPPASPAPGPAEPVVKALGWSRDKYPGRHEAESLFGTYRVFADGTVMLDSVQLSFMPGRPWLEGEAAAQADYERRILSALTQPAPAPVAGGEVVAWQERVAPNGHDWTSWMLREKEPVWPEGYDLHCFQKRPLYTTPDAELEALRERCAAFVRRWAARAAEARRIAFHAGDEERGRRWVTAQEQLEIAEAAIRALPLRGA